MLYAIFDLNLLTDFKVMVKKHLAYFFVYTVYYRKKDAVESLEHE